MDEHDSNEFQLSEQDFLPAPKKTLSALASKPPAKFLTVPLLMAVMFTFASIAYWQKPNTYEFWVSRYAVLHEGKYWKLFTALFTHSDLLHLVSNLPLFLIFGWHLRAFFGLRIFPFVTIAAGITSNFLTIIFYEEQTRLLGASGMLYAMVSLWLTYYVRFETNYSFWNKIMRATAFSLVLLFPTTFQENVSYLAHFWGFVCGFVFGAAFVPITEIQLDPPEQMDIKITATGETDRSIAQDFNGTKQSTSLHSDHPEHSRDST